MTKNKLFWLFVVTFLLSQLLNIPTVLASEMYSNWIYDNPLPFNSSGNQALVIDSEILNFGGGDNVTYHQDILKSTITSNGTLSSWVKIGQLPLNLTWESVTNRGKNLFLLGGAKPDPYIPVVSSIDNVFSSTINTSGEITTWSEQPPLPQKLARGGAFVYNNRLYYVGGLIHSTNSAETIVSTVYFSNIHSDGNISNWVQTTNLPQPRAEFAMFSIGNTIYVVNGMQPNSQPTSTIYKGSIDDLTGQITWTVEENSVFSLRRPAFVNRGNLLYLIGGYNGSVFTNSVYSAKITNGTIGTWESIDVPLPGGSCCNAAVATSDSIYIIGRHDGSNYFPDVLHTRIKNSVEVPNIKQYSSPWGNTEYDNAHLWSPGKDTISRYGCALTSATMVLQYYGYSITPGSLNSWLNSNNGYIGDGLIDWSAITRWVKINHDSNPLLPTLEYTRKKFDISILSNEIDSKRPTIVKLVRPDTGTHFIVAKGKEESDYNINDPATTQDLLSYYPSVQYSRLDMFAPSNTDLSYLYVYTSPNIQMSITDPTGTLITDRFDLESPYIDQVDGIISPQKPLRSFSLEKPKKADYILRVSGAGEYSLETRVYSVQGVLVLRQFKDTLSSGNKKTYVLHIDDRPSSELINFNYVRQSIIEAYKNKLIKSKFVYETLMALLNTAEKANKKDRTHPAEKILETMILEIRLANKLIDKTYASKITKFISYLEDSI